MNQKPTVVSLSIALLLGALLGCVLVKDKLFPPTKPLTEAEELQAWIVKEVYPVLKVRNKLVEQCVLQWELGNTHVEGGWLKPGVAPDDTIKACKAVAEIDTPLPDHKK